MFRQLSAGPRKHIPRERRVMDAEAVISQDQQVVPGGLVQHEIESLIHRERNKTIDVQVRDGNRSGIPGIRADYCIA